MKDRYNFILCFIPQFILVQLKMKYIHKYTSTFQTMLIEGLLEAKITTPPEYDLGSPGAKTSMLYVLNNASGDY